MLLDPLDILETQLRLDDLHVTDGVDVALDVDDLGVIEGADDLEDTVDGAYVRQESVTETCAGGSTLCDARQKRVGVESKCEMRTAGRPAISMVVSAAGTREAGL